MCVCACTNLDKLNAEDKFGTKSMDLHTWPSHVTFTLPRPVKFDSNCCRMVALQEPPQREVIVPYLWASNQYSYGYQPYLLSNTIWLATTSIISNLSLLLTTWRDKYSCFKMSKPNWLFRRRFGDFRLSQLCLHPGHCLESLCACTLLCWTNASRHCRTGSPY